MSKKTSLKELFESKQAELRSSLQDLELPKDATKIEKVVSDYLDNLFDSESEFRLQLTQAEDYILQSAMSLLNAQQAIVVELTKTNAQAMEKAKNPMGSNQEQKPKRGSNNSAIPYGIGGSAVGGVIGAVVGGTWAAVFGAIAGTALSLYYVASMDKNTTAHSNIPKKQMAMQASAKPVQKLDVDKFIAIVSDICESVDNLVNSFRAQVNCVVDKYESMPKPSLETNFKLLLEGLQSLIGYERTHTPAEGKYVGKLQQRVEDVAELLDNYNLEVVNYSGDNIDLFEQIFSPTAKEPKMVVPAIIKDGVTVLKGKLFIPEQTNS